MAIKINDLIFLGGDGFAAAIFEHLVKFDIVPTALFTYPPKERGRGRKPAPNPVKKLGDKYSINVVELEDYKSQDAVDAIKRLNAKLGLVISFKLLPEKVFNAPEIGMINLHPSLLPDLRGAAPLNWAIARGYEKSGFTTFFLDNQIDSGNIVAQKEFTIHSNFNYGDLWYSIQEPAAQHIKSVIENIYNGDYSLSQQDNSKSSYAPRIKPEHLLIDWNKTAEEIHNQIRAFSPRPGAFTFLKGKRVKIFQSELFDDSSATGITGKIINYADEAILVSTGSGLLRITLLQPENKRKMSGKDYWLGYLKNDSHSFGNEA